MNHKLITTSIVAAVAASASAGINSTDAGGYLERAIAMYHERNYDGCLDQLNHMKLLSPDAIQTETGLYYAAMATQGLGDDEALVLLRRYVEDYPASQRRQKVLMSIGDYFFTRSAYADALKAYREVDPEALNDARAEDYIYRTAYCYMLLGEYDMSESQFMRLKGSEAYGNAAAYYIAYIAYAKGDYDRALKLFKEVDTNKEPGNTAPYYMAQIYFKKGDYDNALAMAERVLDKGTVDKFVPECNRIAGESLYNLGREDLALPYLWKYAAAATEPAPSAFYILGLSEYRSGNIDNAIKLLQRAINSEDAMGQSAYLTLGQAYQRRGDNDAALMAFERATSMNYDPKVQEVAYYNYCVARLNGGKVPFGNSVSLFEDFLTRFPRSEYAPKVEEYIVNGYMTDNNYESALTSINRIKNPTPAILAAKQRVLFMTGTRRYSEGRYTQAKKLFDEAAELASCNAEIARQNNMWRGDCNYRLGNIDAAAADYRAYIDATPQSDVDGRRLAWYGLGYVRLAQQKYGDALIDFNRVIDMTPVGTDNTLLADAYNRAGDSHYYMSQFAQAAKNYNTAFELNPSSGDYALFQQAMMKGFDRDYKGKIADIDKLMSLFPTSGLIPSALLEKADSQVQLGNNEAAIETYTALTDSYPSTSQGRNGYLQLAITSLNSGNRAAAIEAYKKVVSSYPSSEEARLAIDDLKRLYASDGNLGELTKFLSGISGAPSIDPSEIDNLTFGAAEIEYIKDGKTAQLEKYLAAYPSGENVAPALYYLAEDAWNDGDNAAAIRYADRLTADWPDSDAAEEVLAIKAQALDGIGKKDLALQTWEMLEEKASGAGAQQQARLGIMHIASELGRDDEVLEVTSRLLASTAASTEEVSEIRYYRGLALNNLRRYDEAEKEWESLADNTDDLYGSQAAYRLAQSLFDRGRTAQAKKVIDKFINANPPHQYWLARGFILYSDILRNEGKKFEADEYLKSLRSNYPGTNDDIPAMIDKRLKK